MTRIYFVRHGSVHNPRDILYGRLPRYRLSELGREQARRTAQFLSSEAVAAIYSSPRLRARQTARPLAENRPGLRVHVSRLLDEVRTGWQGYDSGALGRDFNFYEPRHDPDDETIEDIFTRMVRFIELVLRRYEGKSVACVSHGDPIIIARTGLAGLPLRFANLRNGGYPAPGSVTILTFPAAGDGLEVGYVNPYREA